MEREGLTGFAIADLLLLSSGNNFPVSPLSSQKAENCPH